MLGSEKYENQNSLVFIIKNTETILHQIYTCVNKPLHLTEPAALFAKTKF